MDNDADAQRLGYGIDGNIVVGGTDAASGEQIVVARPQGVDRLDDRTIDPRRR